MYGADIGGLNIYGQLSNETNVSSKPIWQKFNNRGDQWLFGSIKISPTYYRVRFVIEGVVGKGPYGDIAIDDVDYSKGDCPLTRECDFESSDLCGYTTDANFPNFNWQREQASDSRKDHTYGTAFGHFMKASAVQPHDNTRAARLLTTKFSPQQTVCINFWFKTTGSGVLNVRTLAANKYSTNVFYKGDGNRTSEWSLGRATVVDNVEYQVAFETNDLTNMDGEVLLDDIEYNFKACEPVASCSFDDPSSQLCGYRIRKNDFDWVVLPGSFAAIQTIWSVPEKDNTIGSSDGYYLYLDTNDKAQGQKAWLESESIASDIGDMCLSFFIRTNQYNQATLRLRLKNKINGVLKINYDVTAEQTNEQWSKREVQISNSAVPYSILIEGTVGANPQNAKGQFALDDINFVKGVCKSNTTVGPTNPIETTPIPASTTSKKPSGPTTRAKCPANYCQNGGTCSVNSQNELKCKCKGDFAGDLCEISPDQKQPNTDSDESKIQHYNF
jgi:hypothetical protein